MILRFILGLVLLLALLPIYARLEPYWFRMKQFTLSDPDLPSAFEGTRIVFVSDIHHGGNFPRRRVQWLVDTINDLTPDLVIFGGDYYQWDREVILPCFEELQRIQPPPLGTFGVLGNHDHYEDYAELARQGMQSAGIQSLNNRAEWIERDGQRIKIGGVGDLLEDTQDLAPTLAGTSPDDFVLLVSHNPEYVEQIETHNIDIVLSGHTHGGQITFFGLWAPFMELQYGRKYLKGVVETPFTKVIISNGVGMVAVPYRFWARADIVIVTLKRGREEIISFDK